MDLHFVDLFLNPGICIFRCSYRVCSCSLRPSKACGAAGKRLLDNEEPSRFTKQ